MGFFTLIGRIVLLGLLAVFMRESAIQAGHFRFTVAKQTHHVQKPTRASMLKIVLFSTDWHR